MVNCGTDGGRGGDSDLLSDVLRRRRLKWLGHAARTPSEYLPKQVLFGWLSETPPAYGPRLRWRDRIHADSRAQSTGIHWLRIDKGSGTVVKLRPNYPLQPHQ